MGKAIRQDAKSQAAKPDALPPHDIKAEQGVPGCILLSPKDCLSECIEKMKPGHLVFYDLRHQTLYQTLTAMFDEKQPVDLITLPHRLKNIRQMESVGGLAYLSTLPDAVPSAANLQYYLDIVLEKYLLRKMVQTCTGIISRVFGYEGEAKVLLGEVERDILEITAGNHNGDLPAIVDAASFFKRKSIAPPELVAGVLTKAASWLLAVEARRSKLGH